MGSDRAEPTERGVPIHHTPTTRKREKPLGIPIFQAADSTSTRRDHTACIKKPREGKRAPTIKGRETPSRATRVDTRRVRRRQIRKDEQHYRATVRPRWLQAQQVQMYLHESLHVQLVVARSTRSTKSSELGTFLSHPYTQFPALPPYRS